MFEYKSQDIFFFFLSLNVQLQRIASALWILYCCFKDHATIHSFGHSFIHSFYIISENLEQFEKQLQPRQHPLSST